MGKSTRITMKSLKNHYKIMQSPKNIIESMLLFPCHIISIHFLITSDPWDSPASRQALKPLLGDKEMARKALQPCRCTWPGDQHTLGFSTGLENM